MLTTGALTEKYMLVVPESPMPVAFVRSALWRGVWVQLDVTLLMSREGDGVVSRVGLKLAVRVTRLSMDLGLLCSALLTVTHRHNQILQPGGRLYLLFPISKQASGS